MQDHHLRMMIKINKADIDNLAQRELITSQQAENIWLELMAAKSGEPHFNLTNFLYYFGGAICILAMTWFANEGWDKFGGAGLTLIASAYILIFTFIGNKLWSRGEFKIPAGLIYTIAVCIAPLLIFGLQRWTGFWIMRDTMSYTYKDYHEWVQGSWLLMSLGTILAGFIYLKYRPFPFLMMPIAVAFYYIAIDAIPLVHDSLDYTALAELRKFYSMILGVLMIALGYAFDKKEKLDYSFWLYLFGVIAFWGSLSAMNSDREIGKFIYFLINLAMLFLSLYLHRRAFLIFGSIGVMIYMGHLANKVFKDSMLFPVALSVIGLAVIFLGVKYQKNKDLIDAKFTALLPGFMKKFRPEERA